MVGIGQIVDPLAADRRLPASPIAAGCCRHARAGRQAIWSRSSGTGPTAGRRPTSVRAKRCCGGTPRRRPRAQSGHRRAARSEVRRNGTRRSIHGPVTNSDQASVPSVSPGRCHRCHHCPGRRRRHRRGRRCHHCPRRRCRHRPGRRCRHRPGRRCRRRCEAAASSDQVVSRSSSEVLMDPTVPESTESQPRQPMRARDVQASGSWP